MPGTEAGGNVVKIVNRVHIDPEPGNRQYQLGMTEAQLRLDLHASAPVGLLFVDKVGPGDAEHQAAPANLARYLPGREEHQFGGNRARCAGGVPASGGGLAEFKPLRAQPVQ